MAANRPGALQVYDPVLTNVARRFKSEGFIANRLTANIPVGTLSSQYPVFDKEYWFRAIDDNEISDDRAPTNEVDYKFDLESFTVKTYGLKVSITELERQQAIGQLRLRQTKTEFLTHQMDILHERRVAAKLRKTTNGGDLNLGATPSVNWDQDTATIEADIKTGVLAIRDETGKRPNVILIPFEVAYAMCLQEDIRALLRADATGQGVAFLTLGDRILPATIHGMRVVIPDVQHATGNEGATVTLTDIWGDHVRLLYINESAQWGIPSVLYQFDHMKRRVTRWSVTDPEIDYIREKERYGLIVVAPDLGYELTAVLS
jgi:hypothetical protein